MILLKPDYSKDFNRGLVRSKGIAKFKQKSDICRRFQVRKRVDIEIAQIKLDYAQNVHQVSQPEGYIFDEQQIRRHKESLFQWFGQFGRAAFVAQLHRSY